MCPKVCLGLFGGWCCWSIRVLLECGPSARGFLYAVFWRSLSGILNQYDGRSRLKAAVGSDPPANDIGEYPTKTSLVDCGCLLF